MEEIRVQTCPKCTGAMYRASDRYGSYLSCMNCGHLIADFPPPPPPGTKTAWRAKVKDPK